MHKYKTSHVFNHVCNRTKVSFCLGYATSQWLDMFHRDDIVQKALCHNIIFVVAGLVGVDVLSTGILSV